MFPCRVRLFNLAYFCSSNLRSNGDICVPIIFRKYCSKLPANETEKIPTADRYRYTPKNSYNTTQQFQCSSNIQPLRLKPNSNETALELKYRTVYEETWRWLDEYWSSYNLSYLKAKNAYLEEKKKISMEEHKADPCERKVTDLGAFHREFLADNKKRRINFNVEWYKRIAYIVYLSILVDFQRLYNRLHYKLFQKQDVKMSPMDKGSGKTV